VIERIKVTPRMSQSEKDKLQDKVQSAVSMERLQVVHFDVGRSMVGKQVVDDLVATFNSSEIKEKMSDPTLVFVVAGYADKGGNPSANLRLSDDRAQNISRTMKSAGVTNVIHTVAMGATELLGRPDQNRAVEIWAVIP
jgi:outer membrane protein OmpA-like peptidoglycan-associated protein